MSASIHDFLANFSGGGFRPNRYQVILTFPAGVANAIQASLKLGFTCKAASIPGSTIGEVKLPYMGREATVPGDKTWAPWNVTVLLDTDFATSRGAFEQWHDLILGFNGNTAAPGFANPVNAFAEAQVRALDRYDQVVNEYTIYGMYPSELGEVTLGYDQNDMVAEMPITFAHNGWSSDYTPR